MTEEDISQDFRLKKLKEINNYFIKEIDQNELLSNNNKKVCATLNYIEHFLTVDFAVTISISISAFASLIHISKRIMGSTIGLNIWAIIARIKMYKSINKKKKKKHDEIALSAKTNSDCIKDLSRPLADSYIERDYFNLTDVLRKYDYVKEKINKPET